MRLTRWELSEGESINRLRREVRRGRVGDMTVDRRPVRFFPSRKEAVVDFGFSLLIDLIRIPKY